jgi:hypothetical protein
MTDPELIVDAVKNDGTLSTLCAGDIIYPVVLPQDPALPAMTDVLVSQPTEHTQEQAQYRWPRWRFRIYSLKYADLIPIAIGLAAIFGDRTRSPLPSARIEYPSSQAEGHESDTHRYGRAIDVVSFAAAGSVSQ